MLTIKEPRILWAWVCPITGMVLDESWGTTRGYAESKVQRYLGKRRAELGEMRAVRVTIEPLTDAAQAAHEQEFAAWKAAKLARETDTQSVAQSLPSGADAGAPADASAPGRT